MSVSSSFSIPAQPTDGSLRLNPLGGDGYSAPQSMYVIDKFKVTDDASGGTATLDITMDPQFQAVLSLVSVNIGSPAADRDLRIDMYLRGDDDPFSVHGLVDWQADIGADLMFSPPPLFDLGQLVLVTDNVDTETLVLQAIILNFKRDAFQRVPLNVLLASLPRGFDIS